MKQATFLCIVLAFVLLGVLCSGVLAARGVGIKDQCSPAQFARRCGDRPGTVAACIRVDGSDYLLGMGRAHHEVGTVTCPGATPLCLESAAGAVCRAK